MNLKVGDTVVVNGRFNRFDNKSFFDSSRGVKMTVIKIIQDYNMNGDGTIAARIKPIPENPDHYISNGFVLEQEYFDLYNMCSMMEEK